jgi:AsmA protein
LEYFSDSFERFPHSGIGLSDPTAAHGTAEIDAACPIWNVVMRALKIAGAAVAAVIAIAVLLLVIGIPSGFMTSAIQARVERDTGYRLTISGATRIGVWPSLNVTLNDIALQNPKDRDNSDRLTVGRVEADVTLESLWSGHPHITQLTIDRPVAHVPLLRQRIPQATPPAKSATSSGEDDANASVIDHVTVSDGAVEFSNPRDRVDDRIDGINADAVIGGDRNIKLTGSAHTSGHPLKFEIKAAMPAPPVARQNIPVGLVLDMPGVLQSKLSGKAEVRLNGSIVMINGLTGMIGDGAFNGWASVDIASKPLVKLDLDFQRLDIEASTGDTASPAQPSQTSQTQQPSQAWSNAPIDLKGLNYVDAQIKISAAALNIGEAQFAPAEINAALAGGVLKANVSNLGAYGGQANGDLIVDASAGEPTYTLRSDLVGVRALPLLKSAAGFDKLDGKLQAKIAVRATGGSPRAILSNLAGTVFANFQDGAIRGLNVAQMIRSLTSGTLSGWQETREQTTDLTQLAASFRIEKGQATSSDLNLVGPLVRMTGAGTVDLASKSLAFRVEPKLVMTTEGQGRAGDPVGLGIPVVIDGPWAEPRIYPDMAGILDHPDDAYAKLKQMGQGLFGNNGALNGLGGVGGTGASGNNGSGTSGPLGGQLGETLGNLIQQGLGRSRNMPPNNADPAAPSAPAQRDSAPPPSDDSAPMKDVLKQLFNR